MDKGIHIVGGGVAGRLVAKGHYQHCQIEHYQQDQLNGHFRSDQRASHHQLE